MKIFKVSCNLSPNKFDITVKTLEAQETKKTYKLIGDDILGKEILHKDSIMKVSSGLIRPMNYNLIYYRVYCLEEDIENAKELVINKTKSDLDILSRAINAMDDLYLDRFGHM